MDEKVKAVKKSAEAPQPPLKFAKLPILPSVGALGHAEFRSFRFLGLRDTDFFKAGGLWIREVRRSSSLSAQLYTVGPTAIASTQGGLSLSLPPRVRAPPTDGLGRFGPSAPLHDGARPMGLRSASPCLHLGVSIWCSAGPLSRLGVEEAGRSCGPEAVDVLAPHRVRLDPNVERAVAGVPTRFRQPVGGQARSLLRACTASLGPIRATGSNESGRERFEAIPVSEFLLRMM